MIAMALILSFLATAILLARAAILALLRRFASARRALQYAAAVAAIYLAALLLVSLTSHERRLALGEDQCFDDWCTSVTKIEQRRPQTVVLLRVTNQARRVRMRPDNPHIEVRDARGESFAPAMDDGVPLDKTLGPGESFTKQIVFELPPATERPVFVVTEGGWPSRLVIDDENSFFHLKTVTPLK
jgi:hypothetical protein